MREMRTHLTRIYRGVGDDLDKRLVSRRRAPYRRAMKVNASNRRWYALALSLGTLDFNTRKQLVPGKVHRAHLARIALLYRGIGEELDKRGAPLRIFHFVAYAPNRLGAPRLVGQQTRFRAVVQLYEERGRWPLPPALSRLALEVDQQLGHVRPRAASPDEASPAKDANPCDMHAEAEAASALMAQHPEIAAMLAEFAEARRQAT
jgi:hypothetical protein